MRHAIAWALGLALSASALSAQRGHLMPELALALLVEVQSTVLNGADQPESPLPAAGTIVGLRNDTVYVVTSNHHVQSAAQIQVRLTPGGPLLPAIVRVVAPELDFAILAVTGYAADPAWYVPTRVPRETDEYELREPVFVIGCPEGECWVPPERGVLSEREDYTLRVRTLYIREGVSGGPLVDAHGAVIGIVVRHGVAEGTAVRWDVIDSEIRRLGYPVNLPEERGYRMGELSVRVLGATFPAPGLDSRGRHMFPGWRLEFAVRVAPGIEAAAGFNQVSYGPRPIADPDADYREAYMHVYYFAGVRSSHFITRWTLGRGFPDVLSGGLDLLLPGSRTTSAVRMAPTDSVDLARGEYVQSRTTVNVPAGISVGARGSYRIALSRHTAVLIAPSFYLMNFDHGRVFAYHPVLEIGADFRFPNE
ncbi:MAG TPA: serine protease [Longimicrobium sp.]